MRPEMENYATIIVRQFGIGDPFYWHGLHLISTRISYYIHHKVYDDITYLFPNFNDATADVWGWICDFTPHFTGDVVTYLRWD